MKRQYTREIREIDQVNAQTDADMFDVAGFLRLVTQAVRAYRLLVVVTCILTFALVGVYLYLWPPIYKAKAKLSVERDLDPARDTFYSNWQVFRKENPRDEIELFTAGPVLRAVIEKNNLTYDDVYHSFLSHASYLWEKSWPGRMYKKLKDAVLGADPDLSGPGNRELGRTMSGLEEGASISGVSDTYIATLELKGPTRRVSDIANSMIDEYIAYRRSRLTLEAKSALEALELEAERARKELEIVREKRIAFARKHGLMVEFQKESLDVKELTGIETGISNQSAKIASLEASLREIDEQKRGQSPVKVLAATKEVNSVRENARLRRLELETTLIGLRARYREDSPEVKEVLSDIAELDAIIAREPEKLERSVTEGVNVIHQQLESNREQLQSELEGTRASLSNMQRTADEMRDKLTKLPNVMSIALDLNREYDIAAEKYKRLLFRKMEAEVSAAAIAAAPGTVRVIDYAVPPTSKFWPKYKYLIPGTLLVGLTLGVIVAVLRSLTAGRITREQFGRRRGLEQIYATVKAGRGIHSLAVLPRSGQKSPGDDGYSGLSKQATV